MGTELKTINRRNEVEHQACCVCLIKTQHNSGSLINHSQTSLTKKEKKKQKSKTTTKKLLSQWRYSTLQNLSPESLTPVDQEVTSASKLREYWWGETLKPKYQAAKTFGNIRSNSSVTVQPPPHSSLTT